MEVYIVRHGQTVLNTKKIVQSHLPGKLTDLGISQAKELGKTLSDIKFDYIYCSDLYRTKETLQNILSELKYPPKESNIIYTNEIREINLHSLEGKPIELLKELHEKNYETYRKSKNDPNDECGVDCFYRVSIFLDKLIRKNLEENYNSNITKENVYDLNSNYNEEINNEKFYENFKKGLYYVKNKSENNIKILLVTHWVVMGEIINNILFRKKMNMLKGFYVRNAVVSKFEIFKKNNENELEFSISVLDGNKPDGIE